jgi:hypothetical protein
LVATLEELQRSGVTESLTGADGVVGVLPGQQLTIQLGQAPAVRCDFVELLVVGAMRPLDMAVEFGGARGRTNSGKPLSRRPMRPSIGRKRKVVTESLWPRR